MKTRVVPVRFPGTKEDVQFEALLKSVQTIFAEEAEFLPTVIIGDALPEADAAVFLSIPPEYAFHRVELIRQISMPIILISTEYGARSMWDWEQVTYLKAEGIQIMAPYTQEMSRILLRTAGFRRRMKESRLLVWMDEKREHSSYYFFDSQCVERIRSAFGVEVVFSSFKELNERAMAIPDETARYEAGAHVVLKEDVRGSRLLKAYKLYIAMREEILRTPGVIGISCACLDEPEYTDTTPCLAFNLLNRELGVAVACEGDVLSLMTECIVKGTLGTDSFSTNIYPFLMGLAAVRHEKISKFPETDAPDDHALLVHCGYCGLIPETIAESWVLRPATLGMVSEDSVVADARIAEGDLTLVKLHSSFDRWFLCPAQMERYVQYPGSDCRNGGLIRVPDGHRFMNGLYSHHITAIPGRYVPYLRYAGELLSLRPDEC